STPESLRRRLITSNWQSPQGIGPPAREKGLPCGSYSTITADYSITWRIHDYRNGNENAPAYYRSARAESKKHCRARRKVHVVLVYARLSTGRKVRPWRHGRRCRWECVPGLRRWYRRVFHRPLPPQSGGCHPKTVRRIDPHVRNGFLLRKSAVSGG